MLRLSPLLFALLALAAPAVGASYSARLATALNGHVVAREINWVCAEGNCQGATEESRPIVLCQALVSQAGKVEHFFVDGRAFDDGQLAKCNASAKLGGSKAQAAQ